MQDDLLHESLTVTEVLYYAAMLRLPRAMTKQQKVDRVETVIKALGLMKCKDTIVGEDPSSCDFDSSNLMVTHVLALLITCHD